MRTYESNGVVQVIRGKSNAETTVKEFEVAQSSEDRHAGWRYFIEKTVIKPGTSPAEANDQRQAELELREREALVDPTPLPKTH